ncbi:hypothetical protein OCU04_008540 [Sclerotinia nivalis]|uniref:Uncharacterized protein n=1 Tax=Sclerotinia nivalis TaxID=352851 RepID=A0A9X0AIK6_9HELO|nr:hypothetical protein OCU04_008540 [Sclerotinia nivalis]
MIHRIAFYPIPSINKQISPSQISETQTTDTKILKITQENPPSIHPLTHFVFQMKNNQKSKILPSSDEPRSSPVSTPVFPSTLSFLSFLLWNFDRASRTLHAGLTAHFKFPFCTYVPHRIVSYVPEKLFLAILCTITVRLRGESQMY